VTIKQVVKDMKLITKWSLGVYKMRVLWTCCSKGINKSKNTHGVYYTRMKWYYKKKLSKVHLWWGTKDEWNELNSNFIKKSNYHKRTKHHTSFKEMTDKEHDKNLLW